MWLHNNKEFLESDIPEESVGFIYVMTTVVDNNVVAYIGKKNFYSKRKKKFTKVAMLY